MAKAAQSQCPMTSSPSTNTDPKSVSGQSPCSVCLDAQADNALFCPQCGRKLAESCQPKLPPPPAVPPKAGDRAPAAVPLAEGTPVNHPNNQSAVGAAAPAATSPPVETSSANHCGRCGQELPLDAGFCLHCGEPVQMPAAPSLTVVVKVASGKTYDAALTCDALRIGKASDCSLVINEDDYVSRYHARITPTADQLLLEDLASSNGTWLRVRTPMPLQVGDEVLIGTTTLTIAEASSQSQ